MLAGATTTDIFLSERGNDNSDCTELHTSCRTLSRAVQVADGDNGPAVVYIDAARRSTISWLCREEMLQVRGSITIKPRPPTSPSETVRVGCGGTDGGDNRRALVFNISGTSRRTETSLTLDELLVDGVVLLLVVVMV